MREGRLFYERQRDRYDVCFSDGSYHGGLHCGDCFEVYYNGEWFPTRIEYSWDNEEWYLVGFNRLAGSQAQIDRLKIRMG